MSLTNGKYSMNTNTNNKYQMSTIKLGTGSFADVYLGTERETGKKVAIKQIRIDHKKENMKKLTSELKIMQQLKHEHVVSCLDIVQTPEYMHIIMEYCNAGTFADVIKYNESHKRYCERNTHYYLNQLRYAIKYLREMNYVHRDIKPMNVLLTGTLSNSSIIDYNYTENIVAKLADFGLARYHDDSVSLIHTLCGSPLYMAPELLQNKPYDSRVDLWSFGVIMYEMLFGIHPFASSTLTQLKKNLRVKEIDYHSGKDFSLECGDLLKKLLVKDFKTRIDWNKFFVHPWFDYWQHPMVSQPVPIILPATDLIPHFAEQEHHHNLTKMSLTNYRSGTIKQGVYPRSLPSNNLLSNRLHHLLVGSPLVLGPKPQSCPNITSDTEASPAIIDKEDGITNKDEGHTNKDDGHTNKDDGHTNKDDGHTNKDDGHTNKEERHTNKEERHTNKEERHTNKEEGHTNKEEGHTNKIEENTDKDQTDSFTEDLARAQSSTRPIPINQTRRNRIFTDYHTLVNQSYSLEDSMIPVGNKDIVVVDDSLDDLIIYSG